MIGLPLAALIGALLGLFGKWKQGQVVTAVMWGLGGAAGASIIGLVYFLIDAEISASRSSDDWIRLFDRYLSWRQMLIAIGAAGCLSLVVAAGLRFFPSKQSSVTFSLRSLIAAQFLAMIVLGCWTGMRGYVFSKVTIVERAAHKWAKRGWTVLGRDSNGRFSLQRDFALQPIDWKVENENLEEAVEDAWLGDLHLLDLSSRAELDFAILAKAQNLSHLHLRYEAPVAPPQNHLDVLGSLPSLRYLTLQRGDFSALDVSCIKRLHSIVRIDVRDSVFDIPAMRDAIRSLKPGSFEFTQSTPHAKLPTRLGLSEDYHYLHLPTPIEAVDLGWVDPSRIRILQIDGPQITTEAAREIAKMPNLDSLTLHCRVEGSALLEAAKTPKLKSLYLHGMPAPLDRESFDLAAKEVMLAPALENVVCNWTTFKPELDFPPGSDEVRGGIGGPVYVYRPPTQGQIDYVKQINEERKMRDLGELKISH